MTIPELPNDIDELKNLLIENHKRLKDKETELQSKDQEIQKLLDTINILRKGQFSPSTEVVSSKQLGLFNELEDILADDENEEEKEEITYQRTKKKKRPRIPDNLPRVDDVVDLDEKDKICPHDGTALKEIGEEICEKLEIIPAKVQVRRIIRKKYACPCCDGGIKVAPPPVSLLPKSMASASLIAYIVISKFCDALPLYRLENIFKRIGGEITRQSMARWLIQVHVQLIPLYNLLHERLLERDYLQMDETTVQVLKEEGKKATTKSYMWVRHAPGKNPIVLYDYDPTRKADVAKRLLDGFKGYLQVDGYDGYAPVCEDNNLDRVGCWDHCRRKFYQAFKTSGGKGTGKKALTWIKKLYKIEDQIEGFSPDQKKKIRGQKSKPILLEMKEWIDEVRGQITPTSVAGKAINYAFNEWKYLIVYLEDGRINISNCWVENKIRPFCVGRKNWLFSVSVEGAQASAMYYSLIETAKANGIDPFDYLRNMLDKLPHAKTIEDFEALLPFKA